jgi:two-component system, chemotaxis family, chemotaxis protein CheY
MVNCLIVEDNPLNWMIMQNQATKLGLQVTVCTNGLEAIDYCKQNAMPELILLDGYMPEMDGISFLREMREMPNGKKPYVVFCSSSLDIADVTRALDIGAECHFPKPITRDQIVYAIKQVEARIAHPALRS